VIAGALEVTVVGRALLVAVGFANGTIHVEDETGERVMAVAIRLVKPMVRPTRRST
jgi:hypothetical protein